MTHADESKTSAESPFAGTTIPPDGAGVRTDSFPAVQVNEHAPGGMLAGAEVLVRSTSWGGITMSRGRILEFSSVPAAHLVLQLTGPVIGSGKRRIIFCSAIEYIDQT